MRGRVAFGASGVAESLAACAIALAVGAVFLLVTGHDPVFAYTEWVERALLRSSGLQETVVRAIPLTIAGCGVLLAVRTGVWNIGVDGQVLIGAIAAGVVGAELTGIGTPWVWLAAGLAGALAGAVWALPVAWLRARYGINEIVTSIMFNYVAISLTAWLVRRHVGDPSLVSPQTPAISLDDRFPQIGDTRVHLGIAGAVILIAALGLVLRNTVAGLELTVTGANPRAARYVAIPAEAYIAGALIVSGAICALAGVNDVLSTKGTFQAEWNPEYGLAAFAVVFLARRNVAALPLAALFIGAMSYGADVMPRAADIAPAFFSVIEGSLLLALAVGAWIRTRRMPGGA